MKGLDLIKNLIRENPSSTKEKPFSCVYIYIHIYTYNLLSGIVQIESGHNRRPRGNDLSKVVVKALSTQASICIGNKPNRGET